MRRKGNALLIIYVLDDNYKGSVFKQQHAVDDVINYIDAYSTSKKVTYPSICFVTFDVSSLYFNNNNFLPYLQEKEIPCLLLFSYMRQQGFILHVAHLL